jgi:hypothetical protein
MSVHVVDENSPCVHNLMLLLFTVYNAKLKIPIESRRNGNRQAIMPAPPNVDIIRNPMGEQLE